MNKNVQKDNNENKSNNNNLRLMIIIVSVLVAIILIFAAVYGIYHLVKKPADNSPNTTIMHYNMGRTIGDSDLQDIENIAKNIAGDKFIKIEKGEGYVPFGGKPTDENGVDIEPGDSVKITFALLEVSERDDIFNELAVKYGLTPQSIVEIKDIYRAN